MIIKHKFPTKEKKYMAHCDFAKFKKIFKNANLKIFNKI